MQVLPLARELVRRGQRVVVAVREPAEADEAFAGTGVCYMDAPHYHPLGRPPAFAVTRTFAHLLANVGWSSDRKLFSLMCCWANLFAWVRPDVVVFDHAPTALLASRGLRMKRVVIGSGFCVPPDVTPWPLLRRELEGKVDVPKLVEDEGKVLDRANRLLAHWSVRRMDRLGQLYSQADETFLLTFPELEQYAAREEGVYVGPVLPDGGAEPRWPAGQARRVFAYLKRFEGWEAAVEMLRQSAARTLLYMDGLTKPERKRLEGPGLTVETRRVDLRRAAAECDAAVLHAGQGATAAMLLAGKPVLQIPLVLEQRLTAEATARLGAGVVVNDRAKNVQAARGKLEELLNDPKYADAARSFARKCVAFDAEEQLRRMVARVEQLVGSGRGESEKMRQGDTATRGQGKRREKVFAG
jgi:UDP:flavonoid glycosyltransferase YjiC (YdhE family)